jgi:glycosyltransferase involved in cell wall biosynthesis
MTPSLFGPTVSVIIPVHNGGDNFRRCLLSVKELKPSPEEVIVVADGDTDGSWELAEGFDLQVLRRSSPGGPAKARNLGAHNAKGDILLFIDADVTVPYDTIEKVVNFFQIFPDLDALIGSYDDEPFETNFLSQYKNLLHHYVHQTSNREASTFWGACGAIRREVFLKMGGFDKKYRRPSIEDIDLGYRLKKAGFKIYLLKQIQVKHLKHWGIISLLKADFFFRALPWTDLILNEGRFIDDLNLKFSSRLSVMAVFMLTLTFIGSIFSPWLLVPTVFFMVLLFGLNWDLYRFFINKRGLSFAVKTIPWHWLYFFYCGLAFSIGFAKYQLKRLSFEK